VINSEVHSLGYLCVMDLPNARKTDHTKIMSLMFTMHNAADTAVSVTATVTTVLRHKRFVTSVHTA